MIKLGIKSCVIATEELMSWKKLLPGRRSAREQCCSTQSSVERYRSSRLAVETAALYDARRGSSKMLNCTHVKATQNYYSEVHNMC